MLKLHKIKLTKIFYRFLDIQDKVGFVKIVFYMGSGKMWRTTIRHVNRQVLK